MNSRDKDEDNAAFRDSIKGATPLQTDTITPFKQKPLPIPVQSEADELRVMQDILDWNYNHDETDADDTLSYSRPGVQKSVFRKLRKGHYRISGELDLHGMTVIEAQMMLTQFVLQARAKDMRCVRIIHGKGNSSDNRGPVIKPMVNRWLRRRDEVLAFCSARHTDGGTGAVYVLLRRI